jgi:cytochrome P450
MSDGLPISERLRRLPGQVLRRNPFGGTVRPGRVPLLGLTPRWWGRPSLPFPHPWNYREPLRLMSTYYWRAEEETGFARHTRYLDVPGLAPVLLTRDPRVIRAISAETGDKPGQFERDVMPSRGIARATGEDSLLYSNGAQWRNQKKISTPPFARTTLFQPEQFHEFERTFRHTVRQRLERVRALAAERGGSVSARLEPEIKPVMLELLVNNFFGAEVGYEEIRSQYVPAIDGVIDHIVRDTVVNRVGCPLAKMPSFLPGVRAARRDMAGFYELSDRSLAPRREGRALWKQFRSDAPDDKLQANVRSFLAGALEATTSYASWALVHLARRPDIQAKVFEEVRGIEDYTPAALAGAAWLNHALDETLRLTPALYFHPRRAAVDTTVDLGDGQSLVVPRGTHILLDIWGANRSEEHWGVARTGFPAAEFHPERWARLAEKERGDFLHFGFGHGPRFCPGKNLGQLEVALVVGACVKLFELSADGPTPAARAGVSTKPSDGALLTLKLRDPSGQATTPARTVTVSPPAPADPAAQPAEGVCPFTGRGGPG